MPRRDLTFEINSLVDLFSDFLALVLQLQRLTDFGDPTALRRQARALLQSAEAKGRRLDIHRSDIEDATYAVTAFLDEVILNSEWSYRTDWSIQPLQMELFGTNLAGEEFFTRLDELLREQPGRADMLEVYYLCLSLGFEGKYRVIGRERLAEQIPEVLSRIQSLRPPTGPELSPHSKAEAGSYSRITSRISVYALPVVCVAGLLLILILLDRLLGDHIPHIR